MRILIPLLIFTVLTSCAQKTYTQVHITNDNIFGDISDGRPDSATLINITDDQNNTVGKGRYAVSTSGITNIKVGHWIEYYKNGNKKSEGDYKIGSFLDCCSGGFCKMYYYYRSGMWKYYNETGTEIYEVEYTPVKLSVNTRCGDDTVTFGLIKKYPLKYSDILTADKIYNLQKISFEEGEWTTTYTPLNGKLIIESNKN